MSWQPPIPTHGSKQSINAFAEKTARDVGFNPGDLLEPVVTALGGAIEVQDPVSAGPEAPSIEVFGSRDFRIRLPASASRRRNRFSVAHELGHFFLHFPMVQKKTPGARMFAMRIVDEADKEQQRAEWEANWFAAGFLMPAALFSARLRALGNDVAAVAEEFDVSRQAAELRVKTLKMPDAV